MLLDCVAQMNPVLYLYLVSWRQHYVKTIYRDQRTSIGYHHEFDVNTCDSIAYWTMVGDKQPLIPSTRPLSRDVFWPRKYLNQLGNMDFLLLSWFAPTFGGGIRLCVGEFGGFPKLIPLPGKYLEEPSIYVVDDIHSSPPEGARRLHPFWKHNVRQLSLRVIEVIDCLTEEELEYDDKDEPSLAFALDGMVGDRVTCLSIGMYSSDVLVQKHYPSLRRVYLYGHGTYSQGLLTYNPQINYFFMQVNHIRALNAFVQDIQSSSDTSIQAIELYIQAKHGFLQSKTSEEEKEGMMPLPWLSQLKTFCVHIGMLSSDHRKLDLVSWLGNNCDLECLYIDAQVSSWNNHLQGAKQLVMSFSHSLQHLILQPHFSQSSRSDIRDVMNICSLCQNLKRVTLLLECHPKDVCIRPATRSEALSDPPEVVIRQSRPSERVIGRCKNHVLSPDEYSLTVSFVNQPSEEQWSRYSVRVPFEVSNETVGCVPFGILIP